jgi:hypothetical protein
MSLNKARAIVTWKRDLESLSKKNHEKNIPLVCMRKMLLLNGNVFLDAIRKLKISRMLILRRRILLLRAHLSLLAAVQEASTLHLKSLLAVEASKAILAHGDRIKLQLLQLLVGEPLLKLLLLSLPLPLQHLQSIVRLLLLVAVAVLQKPLLVLALIKAHLAQEEGNAHRTQEDEVSILLDAV